MTFQPPSAAGNASSSGSSSSSNPRYTPVSNNSKEELSVSAPTKLPAGTLRLETNFEDNPGAGGSVSDTEENMNESSAEREAKSGHTKFAPKYTQDEEKEIVKIFDRRLVPFLALLYLLSFLDRSSMFIVSLPPVLCTTFLFHRRTDVLMEILEMQKLQDYKMTFNCHRCNMNGCSRHSILLTSSSNG